MNGLAKRKEKSLLSNYLPPLRKKKDVLSCVLFHLTIVWFETTQEEVKGRKVAIELQPGCSSTVDGMWSLLFLFSMQIEIQAIM